MRTRRVRARRTFRSAVLAAGIAAVMALVPAAPAGALTPPTVPASLKVPAGHELYLVGHARGYQVYRCQATEGGPAWVLLYPFAGLVDGAGQQVALHYAGPSWRGPDGSVVVGARVAGAPAPSGTAIPWLLLSATSTSGPPGGLFTHTTYIQRVNTTGGLAPAGGCDGAHLGATVAVFYTADYYFYRAA